MSPQATGLNGQFRLPLPAGVDLDPPPEVEVALLDGAGVIVFVNDAWESFGQAHGADPARSGVGTSYLAACAAAGDDLVAVRAGQAVRSAITGALPAPVRLLVPCVGAGGTGWFDMVVYSRFDAAGRCIGAAVTHTAVPVADPPAPGDPEAGQASQVVPGLGALSPARAVDITGRVSDVSGERDRLQGLLAATQAVATHLDLGEVLAQIVAAARELVGADYAALGVLGADGRTLARFHHCGIDAGRAAEIGDLPTGKGTLGHLIGDPRPLRLADLRSHPSSAGFPEHHPPMEAFLGTPIRIRESVFGNLYLANGPGGREFTEQDEQVLRSLAATAAVAIENARLYQEITWRDRWRQAGIRVTTELLADPGASDLLDRIAGAARELVHADTVAIVRHTDGEATVQVLGVSGALGRPVQQRHLGQPPVAGTLAALVQQAGPVRSGDAHTDDRMPACRALIPELGPLLGVPMDVGDTSRLVLAAGRARGQEPFTDPEEAALTHFVRQAALSLELADARVAAERLRTLEERQRIARDVHDNVLGRLFGIGMALQGLGRPRAEPERLVETLTVELENAIGDLRSTIYTPQATDVPGRAGAGAQVTSAIEDAARQLGFAPEAAVGEAVDTLDADLVHHLVAVLREGLANVARHAGATAVRVSLQVGPTVELTITDNGHGLPARRPAATAAHGHGLTNLAERAQALGGTFTARPAPGGGTVLTWSVPNLGPTGTV